MRNSRVHLMRGGAQRARACVAAGVIAACAAALALPGTAGAADAAVKTVVDTGTAEQVTSVPRVTPIPIRNDFDDLAVRPDGALVVATDANATYTKRRPRPAAAAVRFGPLGVQLPTLSLVAPAARAVTTQSAVTPTGAVVAWAVGEKHPIAWTSEVSDAGVASAPVQLSAAGRIGWPIDVAAGSGGAVGVLYGEAAPDARNLDSYQLAYRASGASTSSTSSVPFAGDRSAFYEFRVALGAAGDGAIAAWSNERHAASLWRIARDGTVGPEIPVRLSRHSYVDVMLAVGGDGTIGATFGESLDRAPSRVTLAQVAPGANTLGPLVRLTASDGASLWTQGVGLAVGSTGRLLASVEDSGGAQVILEGSGASFTKTLVPYVHDGSSAAAWMPDGSAVVVLQSDDPTAYPATTHLFSIRHAPGAAFGAPRQIGPQLVKGGRSFSLRSLVPAPDGTAVLAWDAYDGHRERLAVARITP
ncbi:MAG: hypothetical protein REI11_00575 [Patulibacter sp.]|nr:hypothetical protein [Patulibacter sp.]